MNYLKVLQRSLILFFILLKLFIGSIVFLKLDMKMKMMEGKFHEERLQLQQKHDSNVQKVRSVVFFQE